MKVLQVIDGFGWGGTKEQVYLTTRELKKNGVDVHIALSFQYQEMIKRLEHYQIPIHFFENHVKNARYRWKNYRRLIDIVDTEDFDIVIANSPHAFDYVRIASIFWKSKPKIINVKRSGRIPSFISKYLKYKRADKIVVVSKKVAEELANKNFFPEKLVVIESGIDLERFKPDDSLRINKRKELGISINTKVFINVANWQIQVKAQNKLIEAFSVLKDKDAVLILVGLDTDKYAKEYAKKFSIENQVIGLGFRQDIPELLNMSDFFLLSSNLEGIAGALLQAMATGKVCLSTLAGGIGEYLIDSYNGFSVNVGDFQNFSKKLEKLYNLSQQDYKKISQKAIETAKDFSIENTAKKYIKLFKEIISG